ncbi:cleft lip and palate transmembrane protein 1 (clptm1) protein [Toxoplasma gondii TgCatPRC2]|uniref:Cleft lip and palate transmembrane protein 1 (Clptm1) protein n=1 Tax=Toxoplasma gondii TgCatPRC2 TaxID=1130821 RepID=A0A151HD21_TOXGO|nr:cleft lip and palate transmembrane protein 1 (clptm1) protein [Toxoplasma gondii TgCatPRC2]
MHRGPSVALLFPDVSSESLRALFVFQASGLLIEMALEIVTILYVRDNGDSFLVQIFIFLRLLLNAWKLRKLVTFTLSSSPPYFFKMRSVSSPSASEASVSETGNSRETNKKETPKPVAVDFEELQRFENSCMWYLFLLFLPVVIGVSLHQLVYVPQKGW